MCVRIRIGFVNMLKYCDVASYCCLTLVGNQMIDTAAILPPLYEIVNI